MYSSQYMLLLSVCPACVRDFDVKTFHSFISETVETADIRSSADRRQTTPRSSRREFTAHKEEEEMCEDRSRKRRIKWMELETLLVITSPFKICPLLM